MLSDTDITKHIDKGIKIKPYCDNQLSPIGYDFRVGEWAFSLKRRQEFDVLAKKSITVEPGETVVIETYESMELSKDFGATVHSMVSLLVIGGISHISTTIDPTHHGKLLIQFHNQSIDPVILEYKRSFCTICFYKMVSSATKITPHKSGRKGLKARLMESALERAPTPVKFFRHVVSNI